MRVLSIETSSLQCSVAVGDSEHWLEKTMLAGHSHSEMVLPMVEAVLTEAGCALSSLDGIGFGAGPGSFTGVRIACGVAQGLALGADVPIVPVSTLQALAQASGHERVLACIDARMGEVYFAAYVRSGARWDTVIEPCVGKAASLTLPAEGSWQGIGDGFGRYPELIDRLSSSLLSCEPDAYPSAGAIGSLAAIAIAAGEGVHPREAFPLYVRHRVALTADERARGERL